MSEAARSRVAANAIRARPSRLEGQIYGLFGSRHFCDEVVELLLGVDDRGFYIRLSRGKSLWLRACPEADQRIFSPSIQLFNGCGPATRTL